MAYKILLVSDSHGDISTLARVVHREKPFDILFHMGDGFFDLDRVELPDHVVKVQVTGNMDSAGSPEEQRFELEGTTFLVTHGHLHHAHATLRELASHGRREGADVVLFGHTHKAYHETHEGLVMFNPGAIFGGFGPQSYGVGTLDDNEGLVLGHVFI